MKSTIAPPNSRNGGLPLLPIEHERAPSAQSYERVSISGVAILLPEPAEVPALTLHGQESLLENIATAWAAGLHPSIEGEPGNGKTAASQQAARRDRMDCYMFNGHAEVTPEDLILTGRVVDGGGIEYVGSPLFAAACRGGVAVIDELAKIPSRSLSPLATALDDRRTLTSSLAGITLKAHPDFRFVATMNTADRELDPLPGFIDERLRPRFRVGYPDVKHYPSIVEAAVPLSPPVLRKAFRDWMHRRTSPISPRCAITVFRFAASRLARAGHGAAILTKSEAQNLLTEIAALVVELPAAGPWRSGEMQAATDETSPW